MIDPKSDSDFDCLDGLPRFFRGERSIQGFDAIFERFERRRSGQDESRNLVIGFADEFASMVNFVNERKEKDELFRKLALLLMLSRSFHFSLQILTQQPSAQTLGNTGNREQMGVICLLGDSGGETQRMLFDGDSVDRIKQYGHIGGRAVGWCSINGGLAMPSRVPKVENFGKLHAAIRCGVENGRNYDE